jgi:hypothetical protein
LLPGFLLAVLTAWPWLDRSPLRAEGRWLAPERKRQNLTFAVATFAIMTMASAVSPKTAMPDFNFKPEESRALTLLLLSWRRLTYPPEYIPDPEVAATAMQPSPTSTTTPTPTATPVVR